MEKAFDRESVLIAFLAVVLAFSLLRSCGEAPRAQAAERWPSWTAAARLELGRCIRAESDYFKRDWPLIGWCLVKQWRQQPFGRTIDQQIKKYCAVFAQGADRYYRNPERRRAIRRSTWAEPRHGKAEEWQELRDFVHRFTAGKVPDPCPRCIWWGGHTDRIPEHWTCPVGPVAGRGNRFCYVQR